MEILKMSLDEWMAVAEIYGQGIKSGEATVVRTVPDYEEWNAAHHPGLRFVAKKADKTIGFICVQDDADGTGLVSVYVADNEKRRGVGSALLEKLQRECGSYSVLRSLIFCTNEASIKLHRNSNFVRVGTTRLRGDHRPVEIWEWDTRKAVYFYLADAVVDMDETGAANIAKAIVKADLNAWEAIQLGLIRGMDRVGCLYENEEYFIPELLMCADAMNAAMDELKPHCKTIMQSKGRIVIGTTEGDTHDIGKNIVALMLRSSGYDVLDLGRDVDAQRFVDEAVRFNADIIAISSLMTTTMGNMAMVPELLDQKGLRSRFAVMVGGKPVSPAFAQRIGADSYAKNAAEACRCVRKLLAGMRNL